MHIAFDGGCFQQGILGGIYQVGCQFLNAARRHQPDLKVTLVCDPRQGEVREEAMAGLSWRPDVVYAAVATSYNPPELWPSFRNPEIRFFVDGEMVPATFAGRKACYAGPKPIRSFAIVSRTGLPLEADAADPPCGIRVDDITITGPDPAQPPCRVSGADRRLSTGFLDGPDGPRWTNGAGFIPIAFFDGSETRATVEIGYTSLDEYRMPPGPAAEAVRQIWRDAAMAKQAEQLADVGHRLRAAGCTIYFASHFTPVTFPDMINVAFAYDLIPVLLPQYFNPDALGNFDENVRIFGQADRVYAISDCTRDDLIAHAGIEPSHVLTCGIAGSTGLVPQSTAAVERALASFGLRAGRYIIAVATIEPRKNHLRLLHAYMELRRRHADCPDLLFVGKMGWHFEKVLATREDFGLEQAVKIVSDVSEHTLACLYSGAMFSAYLSVYEGFGLPIVEAMACGCPVLTSDRSSMPEVGGDAVAFANPYDIDSIADALDQLVRNKAERESLSKRGLARARHFTWDRSSAIILEDLARLEDRD